MLSNILYEAAKEAERIEQEIKDLQGTIKILESRASILEQNQYEDNSFFKEISERIYQRYHK